MSLTRPYPGVFCAGHWITDNNKRIDHWPTPQTLAMIDKVVLTNGGAAFNVACDLARLDAGLELEGIGMLGNDDAGAFVIDTCRRHGIGISGLMRTAAAPTSFTDVMTEKESGRRTFFHAPGASALLGEEAFRFEGRGPGILFLGYLGLLPALDALDASGGNGSSRVLRRASESGLLTAADLVSAPNDMLSAQLAPCLPFLDILFTNEWEAARLLGGQLDPGEVVSFDQLAGMAEEVVKRGLRGRCVLHCAGGAVCAARGRKALRQTAVRVPDGDVAGTTGAGDAFAAGFLSAVSRGLSDEDALELAVCTAAVSLRDITCSDAIMPWEECLAYGRKLGYR